MSRPSIRSNSGRPLRADRTAFLRQLHVGKLDSAVVRVEVRATRLREIRESHGLTQRRLAYDLGISQNYVPALEAGTRHAGPAVQGRVIKYFECHFEDIFDVVLIDPDTKAERLLGPAR